VTSGTSFISLWGEARDASPFHPTQFDVRFARLPVSGGGTADLAVALTDSADPIAQGDATTLTATVTNPSATAAQFTVLNVDMPAELAASTATTTGGTCYVHPRFFTCLLGRLAAGASRTVTINAIAIQPGTVSTTATVTSTAADPNSSDNTATTATTLTAGTTAAVVAENGTGYAISDLQTARVPMTVSGTGGRVIDVNVSIRLNHTYDGDLAISLEAPDHTTVTLIGRAGGSGDNFGSGANDCTGTTTNLDDSAGQDYYLASAPFNGTYRPQHPLADLHGVAADGTWTLRVTDAKSGDSGVIGCAKITLTTA
jgi:subtilisin-like proprotein convertase family protein